MRLLTLHEDRMNIRSHRCLAPLLLVVLVVVCHFPLLLNNGAYWDGSLIYGLYQDHNAAQLFAMFRENGLPWLAYLHRLMWFAPNVLLAYKVTAFLSILVATLMVYSVARRTHVLSDGEGVIAAAIFCSYTAYQMYFELITLPYVVCYALFLTAWRLAMAPPSGKVARFVARLAALAMFFVSFLTVSLVAFYGVALLVLLWHRRHEWLDRRPLVALLRLGRFADYLLVPVLFVGIKFVFWKTFGLYATYNQIEIMPQTWPAAFSQFAQITLFGPFESAWALLSTNMTAFVAWSVCTALAGYGTLRFVRAQRGLTSTRAYLPGTLGLVVFCVLFFVAAAFPYVVVGKLPSTFGWDTRHALLVNLPVALAGVLLGRVLGGLLPVRSGGAVQGALLAALIGAFVVSTWNIYLTWELRWIKDASTIVNLRSLPREPIERSSMIWVDDDTARWHEKYVYYEYASIFRSAWHEERRFGNPADEPLDVVAFAGTLPLSRYLLKDLNLAAVRDCRVTLHVRFTPDASHDLSVVARYYRTLWFRHENIDAFLAPLTRLSLSDFSCSADRYARVVADLTVIRNALNAYYADNGAYPVAEVSVNDASHPPRDRWIPGLVPKYLAVVPTDPRGLSAANHQYLYMSNGRDYKIIAHGAEDAAYGRKARPDLVDPLRPEHAFGFWSPGFANH